MKPPAPGAALRAAPPPIGIAGVKVIPGDVVITAEEFSRFSDIPARLVTEKLGFKSLVRWGELGGYNAVVKASRDALGPVPPEDLGAIITLVSPMHLEQDLYGFGASLKDRLGAADATVLDVNDACASSVLSLQAARELLLAEPELKHVLIAGLVMTVDVLDLGNPAMTWAAHISDGAGAVLVSRDAGLDNVLLETGHNADPQFIDDTLLTPADRAKHGLVTYRQRYRRLAPRRLDTPNKDDLKRRMDPVSMPNYRAAVEESLRRSGFGLEDMDYIGPNTVKPSMWRSMVESFKLDPAQQMYLSEVGHMAFLDQYIYVDRIRRERRLPEGGLLVLTTPGVGFHWTALTVAFKGPRLGGVLA